MRVVKWYLKGGENMAIEKKDIRLQVFVTPSMDDKLDDIAEMMGMHKNELVRYAIAQMVLGYETGVKLIKEEMKRKAKPKEVTGASK